MTADRMIASARTPWGRRDVEELYRSFAPRLSRSCAWMCDAPEA